MEAATDPTDVLGRRIAAALLDILLLAALFVVLGVTIGESSTSNGGAEVRLSGWPFVLWIALGLLYYFGTEAGGGRTLGKRALGLTVRRADGGAAGAGPIAVRTLLRLIDSLPLLYLVGFVAVLASGRRRQRLGDMAAGTVVVRA